MFHADQARRLLEELDTYVQDINSRGLGKIFAANLQHILARHLYLSLARLFEPYSQRYSNRSIPAAVQHLCEEARELTIVNRDPLVDFLTALGAPHDTLDQLCDRDLSLRLVEHVTEFLPMANRQPARFLDQALESLKKVRGKAIAHPERVEHTSLMVSSWPKIIELIDLARQFTVLVARSYLNVHYSLEYDASRSAVSLRGLLNSAGLTPRPAPRDNDIA